MEWMGKWGAAKGAYNVQRGRRLDLCPTASRSASCHSHYTPYGPPSPPLPFPFPVLPSEPEPIIHPLPKSWELFAACVFRTFHLICMDRADVVRKTDDLELPQCLPLESPWIPMDPRPIPCLCGYFVSCCCCGCERRTRVIIIINCHGGCCCCSSESLSLWLWRILLLYITFTLSQKRSTLYKATGAFKIIATKRYE